MNEKEQQALPIFMTALGMDEPEERAEYLDQACEDDPELRQRVEELLVAEEESDNFLIPEGMEDEEILEGPGTIISHYKLLEEIGEGGFGVVFMAEQVEPIRRQVALKVVKPGMDTKQVIARFEAERQAVALMDHPNIAQVYDAGATETGRPYFVMELVHGVPITQYCDANDLTPSERLELFMDVCSAIQHAHQKGIIHRDLKPSNILVTLHDGKPVPKVIDFGTAKALQQPLTERTMFTGYGGVIGTPLYMSPEQAEFSGLDVDTRADIYSLGVLLYELLTGTTPLEAQHLHAAAFDEMLRIIRQDDPPKPSARVSTLGQQATEVARHRQVDPDVLQRALRGDLDWIVMKTLEKDRTRRYETASALCEDIRRHIEHQPVLAGPPSKTYRARKFARRHRAGLATSLCIVLILIAGAWISTASLLRAVREAERARMQESRALSATERAEQQELLAAEASKQARTQQNLAEASKQLASQESERAMQEAARAEQEAVRAQKKQALADATFGFLTDELFLRADPTKQPDRDIKLRTVVDQASERLEQHLNDQPLEKGRIHQMLATLYLRLAEYGKARAHADEAVRLVGGELGPDDPKTLACLHEQAEAMYHQGQYDEAEVLFGKVLEAWRKQLGDESPETLQTMRSLTVCLYAQGRYEKAESQFREIIAVQEQVLGPDHPELLQTEYDLAMVLYNEGVFRKAEDIHRNVLESRRGLLGPQHPDTLRSMCSLAKALYVQGRLAEAESLQRDAFECQQRVLGPLHLETIETVQDLVKTLCAESKWAAAEPLKRKLLESLQENPGPDHPQTLQCMHELSSLLEREGKLAEAERYYRRLLETWLNIRGASHPATLDVQHALANNLRRQVKYEEAEKLAMEEFRSRVQLQGFDNPETLEAMDQLAVILYDRGEYTMAANYCRRAVEIRNASLGPDHPETLSAQYRLALALFTPESSAEAERVLRQTLDAQRCVLGNTDADTLRTMGVLASVLRARKQNREADALDQRILELHELKERGQEMGHERD